MFRVYKIVVLLILICCCESFVTRISKGNKLFYQIKDDSLDSPDILIPDGGFGSPCVIKVIGIGGGGGNAVNRMIETNIEGVSFWALNTDSQALSRSLAPNILVIGKGTTRGLGAGGNPDVGRQAIK